jgi:hypothetical protein
MALVLAMKEGEGFSVGHLPLEVDKIFSESEFRLRSGDIYLYINERPLQIAEGIHIKSGLRGQKHLARVWIDADRSKQIRKKR